MSNEVNIDLEWIATADPQEIFDKVIIVPDEECKRELSQILIGRSLVPFIDYYSPLDALVLHTLCNLETGTKSERPVIVEHLRSVSPDYIKSKEESVLEDRVASDFRSSGIPVERQVRLFVGIADIVGPDFVVEVKDRLTRAKIFSAIGQVSLYAVELEKTRRIIAGRTSPDLDSLRDAIESLGVEVLELT